MIIGTTGIFPRARVSRELVLSAASTAVEVIKVDCFLLHLSTLRRAWCFYCCMPLLPLKRVKCCVIRVADKSGTNNQEDIVYIYV